MSSRPGAVEVRAGEFRATVSDPYPCSVEICYRGNVLASIPHSELRDLFYVIQQSMRQAKLKLGDDAQEV